MSKQVPDQSIVRSIGKPTRPEPGQGIYGMPVSLFSPFGGCLGTGERTSGTLNCLLHHVHCIMTATILLLTLIIP